MVNTKVSVLLLVVLMLVAAVAGIGFSQYVSAQANGNNNIASQTPSSGSITGYPYPLQGYNQYGSGQYASSYGFSRGMRMCGCFW